MQGTTQGPATSSAGCHSSQHRWLQGNTTAKHVEVFPKTNSQASVLLMLFPSQNTLPCIPPAEFLPHKSTQVPQRCGLPAPTAFSSSIPVHHAKEHLLLFLVSFTLVPLPEQTKEQDVSTLLLNFTGFSHLPQESSSSVEEALTCLAALVPEPSRG